MLALGKSISCLACVLLVIALAARNPVLCAATEKHNVIKDDNKNASVGAVSTAAPFTAAMASHLTTGLPLMATHAPAATAAPVVHHEGAKNAGVATSVVTTFAPVTAHPVAGAAASHPSASRTVASAITEPPPSANLNALHAAGLAVNVATVAPGPAIAAVAAAHVSVPQRLGAYFEPICQQVDKLEPKQMFKIQAQMKQFIEKTAGKMSLCFMQHYSIDPNLTPVNKLQLGAICSSRPLGIGVKGSFKNFQACAEQNWDTNLDAELERIVRSCENCASNPAAAAAAAAGPVPVTLNNGHSTGKPVVSAHDQQNVREATMISDVVSKVFDNNQAALNKTDIKMIDVGPKAGAAAGATVTNQLPSKEVLNDPNTMVVFVDEPTKTTLKPLGASKPVISIANQAVSKPGLVAPSTTTAIAGASAKPALAGLLTTMAPKPLVNAAAKVASVTTLKPAPVAGVAANMLSAKTTVAPALGIVMPTSIPVAAGARSGLGDKILSAVSNIEKLKGKSSTTAKPAGDKATTAKAGTSKSAKGGTTTGAPKKGSTTKKPTGASKSGLSTKKPHTTAASTSPSPSASPASKSSSTKKPPAASSTAPPTGKSKSGVLPSGDSKVEADAKNAIKALQLQRAQQTHGVSDAHLHQIEHQRQMAIDPIGHTIKHQQYEQRKAALAGAPASSLASKKF